MKLRKKYDYLLTVETLDGEKITYDGVGSCYKDATAESIEQSMIKELACENLSSHGSPDIKINPDKIAIKVDFR